MHEFVCFFKKKGHEFQAKKAGYNQLPVGSSDLYQLAAQYVEKK